MVMNDELLRRFYERLLDVEASILSSNPRAEVIGKFADSLGDFIFYLSRNEPLAEVIYAPSRSEAIEKFRENFERGNRANF